MQELTGTAKLALRDQLLTGRKRLPLAVLGERARALAEHLLAAPEVRRAATVAAYVSVSTEPGTGPLLDAPARRRQARDPAAPAARPRPRLGGVRRPGRPAHRARGAARADRPAPRTGGDRHRRRRAGPGPGGRPRRASGSARAAAATTGRWAGSRSAPSPACCSTTRRSSTTVPADAHDRPVTAVATELGRHPLLRRRARRRAQRDGLVGLARAASHETPASCGGSRAQRQGLVGGVRDGGRRLDTKRAVLRDARFAAPQTSRGV